MISLEEQSVSIAPPFYPYLALLSACFRPLTSLALRFGKCPRPARQCHRRLTSTEQQSHVQRWNCLCSLCCRFCWLCIRYPNHREHHYRFLMCVALPFFTALNPKPSPFPPSKPHNFLLQIHQYQSDGAGAARNSSDTATTLYLSIACSV